MAKNAENLHVVFDAGLASTDYDAGCGSTCSRCGTMKGFAGCECRYGSMIKDDDGQGHFLTATPRTSSNGSARPINAGLVSTRYDAGCGSICSRCGKMKGIAGCKCRYESMIEDDEGQGHFLTATPRTSSNGSARPIKAGLVSTRYDAGCGSICSRCGKMKGIAGCKCRYGRWIDDYGINFGFR
ncbi:hypothetical protein O6P43_003663 [Quillaja saponaria]|uniref:Uncharacterized protein n=1 Tax=Quillaja saponaria TaxID=32244 RepID=A0AAD7VLS9_QUISA|nr:hypothetical protein O6P43_003663 [Quillaja saponaria]